ncbi:hypothetical protein BCV69DRAFT_281526 [Microstroma glucosiphilum]|uniref:Uncharacterized protein n=1 Tax=Pseudomicrostroma glucosiphilum TaxID=1684307 RepID=A0A316UBE4_9BASI|nr:hypothetical protein BCV69DRAFT_281526 [Pseudomicrostroma glucosiphilum]PWN22547.1 hypothetical protein BCV69DRAFT_281526 [Pseudomicrostroma glucosiphilum]
MPPKRNARQTPPPSELNSSASNPCSSTSAAPVAPSLSSLSPKACLTCGRMITPRAKWAKNWSEIKTCSDACKAFKVGSRGNIASVPREEIERRAEEEGKSKSMEGSVKETLRALAGKDGEGLAQIDVDAWIELALLRCAAPPSASSTLPTTDDVDAALERVARSCGDTPLQRKTENAGSEVESSNEVPPRTLLATLQSGPGLRERVRRAARRLFILPVEHWACRDVVEHKAVEARTSLPLDGMERGLDLVQGGKVLKGLEGVSFAKGPIGLERRQR